MAEHALSQITKLSQRVSETFAEQSRDLKIAESLGGLGSSSKYFDSAALDSSAGLQETRRLLSSHTEAQKVDGLRRILVMMLRGQSVTEFFPLVTSMLSQPVTLQVRTLISTYVIHCANVSQDVSLLAINTYQKDLGDSNPLVRARALKTLVCLNVDMIWPILTQALDRGSRDLSPIVRVAVAQSLATVAQTDLVAADEARLPFCISVLETLLSRATSQTIGSTLLAWELLCPQRWTLLHPYFTQLSRWALDADEWGQVVTLRVLRELVLRHESGPSSETALALRVAESLLHSMSPSVVSEVCKIFFSLSADSDVHAKAVRALLFLATSPSGDIRDVAMVELDVIAKARPTLLRPHRRAFFMRLSQSRAAKRQCMRILVNIIDASCAHEILGELGVAMHDTDSVVANEAISAIGVAALQSSASAPLVASICVETLGKLVLAHSPSSPHAILVFAAMLCSAPDGLFTNKPVLVEFLATQYVSTLPHEAKSAILSLVLGELDHNAAASYAQELMRRALPSFASEPASTKLVLLNLAAKVHLLLPSSETAKAAYDHAATLARYDVDVQLRDRYRYMRALVSSFESQMQYGEEPRIEGLSLSSRFSAGDILDSFFAPSPPAPAADAPSFSELGSLYSVVASAGDPGALRPSTLMDFAAEPLPWDKSAQAAPRDAPARAVQGEPLGDAYTSPARETLQASPVRLVPQASAAKQPLMSLDQFYESDGDTSDGGDSDNEGEETSGEEPSDETSGEEDSESGEEATEETSGEEDSEDDESPPRT